MHVHARGSKRGRPRAPVGYARLAPPPLSAAAPHFAGRPPPGHIDPTRTARWGGARASAACLRGRRRDENARAKPRVRDPWRLPFPRAAAAALLPLAPAAARRATWSSAGKCWAACTGQGRWAQGGGGCAADTTPSAAMDSQASTSHPACASPALLHPPMASQMGDLGGYTGACGSRVRDAAHGERRAGLWPRQGAGQPQEKREAGLPAALLRPLSASPGRCCLLRSYVPSPSASC